MDPSVIGVFIPIIALMIPIVAILVKHQQKMAELIHQNARVSLHQGDQEVASLRAEVRELRELVARQAIMLDDMASLSPRHTPPQEPLQGRFGN